MSKLSKSRGRKKLEKALNQAKEDITALTEKLMAAQTGNLSVKILVICDCEQMLGLCGMPISILG